MKIKPGLVCKQKKIILENSLSNKFQKRPRQLKTQNFISANNLTNEPNSVSTNDL